MLFRRLFLCALLAGLCAGLAYSVVQRWQVVPLIAAAEVFESALEPTPVVAQRHPPGTSAHTHDAAAWQPQAGLERTFWTLVANVLGATGFALLLIPPLAWWDRHKSGAGASLRTGLLWGAAGWLCLFAWPAIGMPPELPGQAVASLPLRQAWWLLAVACAAGAVALLTLAHGRWRWLGLPLLGLPFLVGAPQADGPAFAAFPADAAAQMQLLASQFFTATALANAVQWLVLGAVSGLVVARWLRPLLAAPSGSGALRSTVEHAS